MGLDMESLLKWLIIIKKDKEVGTERLFFFLVKCFDSLVFFMNDKDCIGVSLVIELLGEFMGADIILR